MKDGTIKPIHLDGLAALLAAERTSLRKEKGEMDTAFIKRIVCAYVNAANELRVHDPNTLTGVH